jgi:ATP/maltotriose-dependent transcriptional regulator MalT
MVMSPRLQEILDARLGNLHTDQVALMEVLAYTEPASVSFLEAMFSSSALEAAERQGVVVVEKDGRRLAGRLAHPLYGESVRARCPVLRARDIQRRFAAAVEATGARRRDDLLRMVTARLEAGETAPPEQLLAGARRAYVLDPVLAERLARAAADAGGGIPAQYSLVVSLFGQGRFSEMESVGAGEQRGPANDSERVMETVKSAWALWISEERPDDAHDLLLQAEHDIQDAALRDKLKQTRGFILLYSGRPAEAIPELSLILDRPGANELTCLLAAVVAVLAFAISGRTEQAVAIAERWIDCAYRRAEKSPLSAGRLLTTQSYALMLAGRLREAEALARKEYRRSLSHHASETTAISTGLLGRIALARGLVETAALWLREGAALFRSPSGFTYFPLCLSGLACAAALKGDHVIAQAALVEADDISTPGMAVCEPDTRLAGAWVAAAAGEMSNARAIALEAAELAEEQEAYAYALPALHDVARLGGAGLVATRLRRLASIVEGPFAPACVAHAEALVAHDGAGLDQASAAFEAMGAQLLAAEAAAEAAAAYRAEGRQASMRASSATARRLLQNCEGARTPALSGLAPDPLTSREREVAMLAAKGLTSAEIAERLVLSRRTVENHLQRGYAKLGVTNRTELQSVLAQADEGHGSLSARHQPDLKYPAGQS